MKKVLLLVTVVCGLSVAAQAQTRTVKKKKVTTTRTTAAAKSSPTASTTTTKTATTTTTPKAAPVAATTTTTTRTSAALSPTQGKFSIGVEVGLPLGDAKNASNLIIGGSLKYEHPVAENVFITGSAGYSKFLNNEEAKAADYSFSAIPVKVGVKYFFDQGFYGEAQIGAAFLHESIGDNSGNATAFAYSPGIGYAFTPNFDIGVRYEGWSKNGTLSQVAARLAYSF
ncbi:hypothetical protein D0C36_17985 [Mucilaginibacter conchicola]|uniref:Outer membrane protein beta-barrel domain-containing protein n=1 Tax=Mucilaginibacter conchicola TaxID=2303333 RepID=A0A372NPJ9_9SPHI|nr:acyloxyacyl hydrolase [Mucilaginibacter conchicola]RFZ90842.1 hypothetical protein D0C36_17985 [Mucilaginibacter conchicola]